MHWVIQSNLYNEAGYVAFMNALERLNLRPSFWSLSSSLNIPTVDTTIY
jgi:hypothetical protein